MPAETKELQRAWRLMKTEFVDVSPTRKEIKIEIEVAAVRESYDRISDRYAKQARVPGFRPGHAPPCSPSKTAEHSSATRLPLMLRESFSRMGPIARKMKTLRQTRLR